MAKRPSLAESMKSVQQAPTKPVPEPQPDQAEPGREGVRYHSATREGMKRVTAVIPPADHRKLKRLSADSGTSIEELMREALAGLFAKHGV